ncbi:MAG: AI-2E family transporter [Moheibacter sp.]
MGQKYISNNILRQVFFILIALSMLLVVIYNLSAFIPGLLGAFCLYVLMIHPLRWLMFRCKINKLLSVLLLMLASLLVIVTPLIFLVNMLTERFSQAIDNSEQIQAQIGKAIQVIHAETGIDILHEINISDVTSVTIKVIQSILNASVDGLLQIGVAYLLLYFMLMNYRKMENWFYNNIPLKSENLVILNKDLRDLVISNAVGVPLVAILQAIVAYIGYLIFGLDGAFSWFVLTAFGAMLPIVGAASVYVPACIYMIANGEANSAYFLLAYCFLVVGLSDNLFRLWTQKAMADVHPLITIFGVILGLNVFGFIGIIFGPILLSLTFWLFRIYKLEFTDGKIKSIKAIREEY